jgi:hypothetical protein
MSLSGRLQSMARKNAAGYRSADMTRLALPGNWEKGSSWWIAGGTIIRRPGIPNSDFSFAFFAHLDRRSGLLRRSDARPLQSRFSVAVRHAILG